MSKETDRLDKQILDHPALAKVPLGRAKKERVRNKFNADFIELQVRELKARLETLTVYNGQVWAREQVINVIDNWTDTVKAVVGEV